MIGIASLGLGEFWRRESATREESAAGCFAVEVESRGDAAILRIEGRFTADRVEAMQKKLRQAAKQGAGRIVVDLAGCPYMDSAGVAALVAALGLARKKGRAFVLAGVSPQLRRLMRLTRLDGVFDIRETVETALAD